MEQQTDIQVNLDSTKIVEQFKKDLETEILAFCHASANFQTRVNDWLTQCMGEDIARSKQERNHRFLEESLELVQSCGVTKEECLQLVEYVFSRPWGETTQEVGGVMNTLAALCNAHNINLNESAECELARCWDKIDMIREKRKNKPEFGPLPQL